MWINRLLMRLKVVCFDAKWQTTSGKRIIFALVLSLFLHFFLIGQFSFNLPSLNNKQTVIEAQLVLPKTLPKVVAPTLETEAAPIVKPAARAKPAKRPPKSPPVISPPIDAATAPEPVPQVAETLATEETHTPQPASAEVLEPVTDNEISNASSEENEENTELTNANAYQYVETDFDVYTDKEPQLTSNPVGKANMQYQRQPNGKQYKIKSLIQGRGLVALVVPDLLQTSEGYISNSGLKPEHYLYQLENKKNKSASADFDWARKALYLHGEKGDETLALASDSQDLLSFMYQFMFVPPLQNMQLSITNGKKLGVYTYSFEGEEVIETKMGALNTIHIQRMAAEGEKKTELWLALDYQYVPVKMRETKPNGDVYELLVKNLKTTPPATP